MDEETYILEKFGKIIGHICGVISIAFTSLSIWALIKTATNPGVGSTALTGLLIFIAIFFFKIANQLTSSKNKSLFNEVNYLTFFILLCCLGVIFLISGISKIFADELDVISILFFIATSSISFICCNYFRKEFIRLKKKKVITGK